MLNLNKNYYHYSNPFKTFFHSIKQFFYNRKMKKQRIKRGFCDMDVWEYGGWLSELLPDSLEYLANNLSGYPDGFEDEVEWKNMLLHIVDLIRTSTPEYYEEHYQYQDAYFTELNKHRHVEESKSGSACITYDDMDTEVQRLKDLYMEELRVAADDQLAKRTEAMTLIAKYWNDLWD